MQDTKLTSVVVAQPQDRNMHNKVSFRECLGGVFRPHLDLSSRHPAMLNPSTMHLHPTAAPTLLLPLPGSDRSLVAS
jgi:hypothetical protein